MFFSLDRVAMNWSDEKDLILMKQMSGLGIFSHKSGSKERGKCWLDIANTLNKDERFRALTHRGARDRFTLIARRQKAKSAREEKSTGGGGEPQTESEILAEELIHLNEECERTVAAESEAKYEKAEAVKHQAMDIRKKAMETMGETRKREKDEEDDDIFHIKEKKKRRSGSDTLKWLEQKKEMDEVARKEQMEEQKVEREILREQKKQELEIQQKQLEALVATQRDQQNQQSMMFQQMSNMFQQQQQQQQQLQAMMASFLAKPKGN